MKPKFRTNRLLAGSIALFAAVSSAHAQLTWDANGAGAGQTNGAGAWLGTGLWWDGATNTDWVSGSAAIFGGTATAAGAVTLASPTTVESLTFSPSYTGTYTLGTVGQTITLNSGITKNASAGAVSIISPITLGGAQTWTNSSGTALTTSNGTNLITNGGFDLTVDATGSTNMGAANNLAAVLTGAGNLIKNGSGRLSMGGINSTFTGTVTINGGVLQMYNDARSLGAGNVTLNGGVLSGYWGFSYNRTLGTGDNQVQILGGQSGFAGAGTNGPTFNLGATVVWGALGEGSATGFFNPSKFVLGDSQTGNAAVTTFSSAIDLNGATRTIVVPPGANAGRNRSTISGRVFGTADLVKEGAGWLFLTQGYSGTNVGWSGSTTVSQGMLDFTNANMANIGGGSGRNITVAAGAGVRYNALTNAFLNRIVETTDEITVMTSTTTTSFDFSSSTGANLPNAFLGNWAANGSKMEYGGTFTPASDNYRLGSPSFNSGLLGMLNTAPMTGTQGLIIGGGSVQLVGAKTFTGDTVIRTGGRLGLAAFTGGSEALALQNSALDVGSAGGTFWLHKGTAVGPITGSANTTTAVFGGLKGSRNLSSVYSTTTGANNSTAQAVVDITGFTLNPGASVTCSYTGIIANFAPLTTLTKAGEGTQILTGTHTYTGATTISGGTLDLGATGSIAASTSLVLGAAGTLDTSDQASYTIPAAQPVEFGIDAAGSGSSGKIVADGLDVSNATVTYNIAGPLDDAAYVLATCTAGELTGTFMSAPAAPSGYELVYDFEGNKIALVSTGAPTGFAAWQSANSTGGTFGDDHDGDGVDNGTEFFLGGSSDTTGFTALPGVDNTGGTLSVTWTKAATYGGTYGTDFVVETSATLATGSWATEIVAPNPGATVTITGDEVKYTFPAGTTNFARLRVTGPN